MLTKLYSLLLHPVGGVPAWFPILVVMSAVASQAIKVSKWTTAQRDVELLARFALKLPIVGNYIALIPILGDILHYVANDTENLPPTLAMRVRGKVPPKAPPPPSAAAIMFLSAFTVFACAHVKQALIDFGKCELGQVPSPVTGIVGDVNKALDGDSWQSDLENIGKKAGVDAVNCAIASILHEIAQIHGELTAATKSKVVRGKTWLAAHGHAAAQR